MYTPGAPGKVEDIASNVNRELHRISSQFTLGQERVDELEKLIEVVVAIVDFLDPIIDLPPNTHGYDVQVLPQGDALVAIPNEAPSYTLDTVGVTDHDLSATEIWTQITVASVPATSTISAGNLGTLSARAHERGSRGGTVSLSITANGAFPTVGTAPQVVQPGEVVIVAATLQTTVELQIGDTISVWAKAENNHNQSNIWIEGTDRPSAGALSSGVR